MKGLYFDGKEVALRRDLPVPETGRGESLIKISAAAVCNTDKEILKGYMPGFRGVMGHEFVGVVEKSDDPALIGKRVVGEINLPCGDCLYCRTGRYTHCMSRTTLGIGGHDGCFAEYLAHRNDLLYIVPDSLSDGTAVFTEPLAAAVEITERSHIRPSEPAAVVGDGRLAFMAAQVLSLTGAPVTVIGKHPEKLEKFRPFAFVTTEAEANAFETVVECSGSPTGLETAAKVLRPRGRLILKSTYAGKVAANLSAFVVDEVSVVGSRCGPFAPALRLLERGLVTIPPIELHPIEDWKAAFESKAFKAGFNFR